MLISRMLRVLTLVNKRPKRVGLFTMALFVASLSVSTVLATPQTTQAGNSGFGTGQGLASNYSGGISTCAIQTVGWIICPVMRSIAMLADFGFAFINENFLMIEYELSSNDSGVYIAWGLMRNIGNVLFVLVFLYIVYAQMTGKNTGNFNLKRILPRLILGAILLNVSYWVCVIGVQASNITGSAITQGMATVTERIGTPAMSLDSAENGFEDGVLTDITNGILNKTGTVWVLLAPVAAVTIAIAITSAAGLVLLIMRKVLVSMLIFISPLAFVAYVLPNLERYFQQWGRLFVQMLLLYPIIAFLLGAGQIVSATIINVGSGGEANYSVKDDSYQSKNGSGSATTDLAAAGAAVLPLLGVWFIMKNLSTIMSTAGAKIATGVSRARSRANKAEENANKPRFGRQQPRIGDKPISGQANKPSFTRRRRKASIGGSAVASALPRPGSSPAQKPASGIESALSEAGRARTPQSTPLSSDLTNPLGEPQGAGGMPGALENAAQVQQNLNNTAEQTTEALTANDAQVDAASIQAALANAVPQDEKKGKTAKDIFNNMNHSRQGGGGTGSSGGGQAGGGQAPATPSAPSAPAQAYRAPAMSQAGGAAPTPAAPSTPQRVIAVPVQIDASALTGGGAQSNASAAAAAGSYGVHDNQPVSGTEAKAKSRAQKYIFDAANDVEEARRALDLATEQSATVSSELSGTKKE